MNTQPSSGVVGRNRFKPSGLFGPRREAVVSRQTVEGGGSNSLFGSQDIANGSDQLPNRENVESINGDANAVKSYQHAKFDVTDTGLSDSRNIGRRDRDRRGRSRSRSRERRRDRSRSRDRRRGDRDRSRSYDRRRGRERSRDRSRSRGRDRSRSRDRDGRDKSRSRDRDRSRSRGRDRSRSRGRDRSRDRRRSRDQERDRRDDGGRRKSRWDHDQSNGSNKPAAPEGGLFPSSGGVQGLPSFSVPASQPLASNSNSSMPPGQREYVTAHGGAAGMIGAPIVDGQTSRPLFQANTGTMNSTQGGIATTNAVGSSFGVGGQNPVINQGNNRTNLGLVENNGQFIWNSGAPQDATNSLGSFSGVGTASRMLGPGSVDDMQFSTHTMRSNGLHNLPGASASDLQNSGQMQGALGSSGMMNGSRLPGPGQSVGNFDGTFYGMHRPEGVNMVQAHENMVTQGFDNLSGASTSSGINRMQAPVLGPAGSFSNPGGMQEPASMNNYMGLSNANMMHNIGGMQGAGGNLAGGPRPAGGMASGVPSHTMMNGTPGGFGGNDGRLTQPHGHIPSFYPQQACPPPPPPQVNAGGVLNMAAAPPPPPPPPPQQGNSNLPYAFQQYSQFGSQQQPPPPPPPPASAQSTDKQLSSQDQSQMEAMAAYYYSQWMQQPQQPPPPPPPPK
jgi:hypothetical protein